MTGTRSSSGAPRPGDFPVGSIESRATARAMLDAIENRDCICFPVNEPPAVVLSAEREAVKAALCPIHGLRFARFAPFIYRPERRPTHLREEEWNCHSAQYIRAMRASFPLDLWPATEIRETDGTARFVLKDGTEILRTRTEPPQFVDDY
jgi:hypothetical protein